jgi:hypothetical protein
VTSPAEGEPDPATKARAARFRWLARGVVGAIGLWFLADGLSGMWPGAGTAARALIVVAAVLGVVLAVVGVRHLARRGRGD